MTRRSRVSGRFIKRKGRAKRSNKKKNRYEPKGLRGFFG